MIRTLEPPTLAIPTDVETLRQMVSQLLADLQKAERENLDLQHQLGWFKRHMFGRRSEKLDPNQLALFAELASQLESTEDVEDQPALVQCKKSGHGRRPLPEHLPRERIEYHPDESDRTCPSCHAPMNKIGQEITEELDYVPASLVVREHVRIKYACKRCQEGVVIGELPPRPIDKGRPGPGLLAQVLTSKYADHLPLHRQEGIFQRHGVDIARSTMCDWVRDAAGLLHPIVKHMKQRVLESKKIHTDDTPVPVLDKSRTRTRRGYLWVYMGEGDNVVFDYTPTRSRDGPLAFLGNYAGYVQADAYSGYDEYFNRSGATEVGCWAHARRKFMDAKQTDQRAQHALALIGRLYAIESQARDRGLDGAALCRVRQERSKPILDQIERLIHQWSSEALPKSPLGQAAGYARRQWAALTRYLSDGDLDIDNNAAERALRMVAVGRKNWMFAGSDAGGQRAAIIYSLVASCKLCQIDPFAYLRDVIERVSTHPAKQIAELKPQRWKRQGRTDQSHCRNPD